MSASPHWSSPAEKFGSVFFHVTGLGRFALRDYLIKNVDVPARYAVTYKHHEGESIVSARSRSGAKYAAYLAADIEWPFIEFASEIKSVRLHSRPIMQEPTQ